MEKLLMVLCAVCLMGQAAPNATPPTISPDKPIASELDGIYNGLVNQLHEADDLVKRLKDTAAKNPQDTKAQIQRGATTLSVLADRTAANGELAQQVLALRNAAAVHRKRIQELPQGALEEEDRTSLMNGWDRVIQEADKAQAAMQNMHDQLLNVLDKLRKRQTAMSEMMLSGQYQEAVNALRRWIDDLDGTVKGLHKAIDNFGPRAAGT